jgi:hypothetical protein
MKPVGIFAVVCTFMTIMAACIPASAQSQIDDDAWNRFARAYSEVFLYIQQERNCCATRTDPFPLLEASINRIIARFKAVDAAGIHPEVVKSWENLRDKHIAGQEAQRNKIKFLVKAQTEHPGFRADFNRDPRSTLPSSLVPEWDALVAADERAESEMNSSVTGLDAAWAKYGPKR